MELLEILSIGYCELDKNSKIKRFNATYESFVDEGTLKTKKLIHECVCDKHIVNNFDKAKVQRKKITVLKNQTIFKFIPIDKGGVISVVMSLKALDSELNDTIHDVKNVLAPLSLEKNDELLTKIVDNLEKFRLKHLYPKIFS